MSKYPYIKLVMPASITKVGNGNLTPNMLKKVKTGGVMWTVAADAFNDMYDAALAAGFKLKNVGDYRPVAAQLSMFKDRYSDAPTGRKPEVTREYQGKKWYLKSGKAPSSSPGKSNHGFGLAIDLGYENGGKLTSMSGKCLDWMCENAPKYGFYLQGSDPQSPEFEAWHWQYCLGDKPRLGAAVPTPAPTTAPAPAPALKFEYPGAPVKQGSKGNAAKLVQEVISAKADGDFGAKSVAALKVWQTKKGLTADGVVGPSTWVKMFG
jgi:hypothetical protein